MSDNWIIVIPESPEFVPSRAALEQVRAWFERVAPEGEIEISSSEEIGFFDCGANFSSVGCPECNAELDLSWWGERMDEDDSDAGFSLRKFTLPCCRSKATLHELKYDWAQGFGRFSVSAMNPNIGQLTKEHVDQLEQLLGSRVRVIYQHL